MEFKKFANSDYKITAIEKGGEPWFIANEICKCLGIKNTKSALKDLEPGEIGTIVLNDSTSKKGGFPNRLIISESGLYALIMRSRKESARKFQKWVTGEVLPSIRKTGNYEKPEPKKSPLRIEAARDRVNFTGVLKERGYRSGDDYRDTTNNMKEALGISVKNKKKDFGRSKLIITAAAEMAAAVAIRRSKAYGFGEVDPKAVEAAANTRRLLLGEEREAV